MLSDLIEEELRAAGGWIGFDRFMDLALYAPGQGYYASQSRKFGAMPASGSDFVTAPEMTPLFAQALARQVAEALQRSGTREIWEFGAGSGALAADLLDALRGLGVDIEKYRIVELSSSLRERQRTRLQAHQTLVEWPEGLPGALQGVLLGNEVLDAMPVQLLARVGGVWHERGVALNPQGGGLLWADRPSELRPSVQIEGEHDYLTEIHPRAEAFVRTLAERLGRSDKGGTALLIDYGFPEGEYYHAQRHMGTLMCHRGHRSDMDPLADVGLKDITAHVNFTGIALAAQEAGMQVLGYTSQARFLLNCGLPALLAQAGLADRALGQKLINEHEMGELFKVIAFGTGPAWEPLGFLAGDRTHTL